jgi:hypothetical protein
VLFIPVVALESNHVAMRRWFEYLTRKAPGPIEWALPRREVIGMNNGSRQSSAASVLLPAPPQPSMAMILVGNAV